MLILGIAGWCFFVALLVVHLVTTRLNVKKENALALQILANVLWDSFCEATREAVKGIILAAPSDMKSLDVVFQLIEGQSQIAERTYTSNTFNDDLPSNLTIVLNCVEEIRNPTDA